MKTWYRKLPFQNSWWRWALLLMVLGSVSFSDRPDLMATGGHWELSPYSSSVEFCDPPELLCAEWEFDNGFVGPTCCIQSEHGGTSSGGCVWDIATNGPWPFKARPGIE